MVRTNKSLYVLALFAFCLLVGAALYYIQLQSTELQKKSSQSITTMQQKSTLINAISQNLRARSYLLLTMLNEKDAFILDELNIQMNRQGAFFRRNRDALKALPLTPPQVKALGELYNLTTANSINQHKVINLLIEDDKDTAATLLFEQAIPNQVPMRAIVSDIITMVENENARITGGLQIDSKSKQQISFALTLMLGLFAVILISLLLKGIKIGDVLLTHKTTVHDSLISSAIDAIVVMNDDGVITAFNKGASLLFGYKEADIINDKF
ncbi:MAG: PAS domain S-box protein [Cycloclasticus sp.]|jgi:PAS domain-containing protein